MKCTNKEQETCNVEKMGCVGCAYYTDKCIKCYNSKALYCEECYNEILEENKMLKLTLEKSIILPKIWLLNAGNMTLDEYIKLLNSEDKFNEYKRKSL